MIAIRWKSLDGLRAVTAIAVLAASLVILPHTASANDFYAGKTITIATHGSAGGGYDSYLRLFARFFGKYIPGHPRIVVVNQTGAGGLIAVNYAARIAPQDGTHLVMVANGLLLFQVIGQPGLEVSLGDLKWIGNFDSSTGVTAIWSTAGVRTIQDAMHKQVVLGSSGAGSISALLPAAYNALAGTKFKVILGYKGARQMNMAMRKGEIQGHSGNTWASWVSDFPEVKQGKLIPLSQVGMVRDPRLPNVPLLTELVGKDPKKLAAARLVSLALIQNRSVAAPPGVPDERVALLRTAFEKVVHDPDFLATAKRAELEIRPTTGQAVAQTVHEVLSMPKDVIETARQALELKRK